MSIHILQQRLPVLEAIIEGLDRHDEVAAVVAAAPDRAAARAAVGELLGVDEIAVRAVLDRRLEELHGAAVQSYRDEYDTTADELARRQSTG